MLRLGFTHVAFRAALLSLSSRQHHEIPQLFGRLSSSYSSGAYHHTEHTPTAKWSRTLQLLCWHRISAYAQLAAQIWHQTGSSVAPTSVGEAHIAIRHDLVRIN